MSPTQREWAGSWGQDRPCQEGEASAASARGHLSLTAMFVTMDPSPGLAGSKRGSPAQDPQEAPQSWHSPCARWDS